VSSLIRKLLPGPVKSMLRRGYYALVDRMPFLDGGAAAERKVRHVGAGDFDEIGKTFLRYFIELGDLKPGDTVLDVGCGFGRMALPLTGYLRAEGRYCGIDIVRAPIRWCQRHIATRHPNFCFEVADVYKKAYNPRGRYEASDYRLPYDSGSFDFVFLVSVFTHLLPPELRNYLAEVSRVLREDGRCLITYFLLNPESQALIRSERTSFAFPVRARRLPHRQ
jgi:ubiquinone/menaquinone biosynthesis C-methylase UbiE